MKNMKKLVALLLAMCIATSVVQERFSLADFCRSFSSAAASI